MFIILIFTIFIYTCWFTSFFSMISYFLYLCNKSEIFVNTNKITSRQLLFSSQSIYLSLPQFGTRFLGLILFQSCTRFGKWKLCCQICIFFLQNSQGNRKQSPFLGLGVQTSENLFSKLLLPVFFLWFLITKIYLSSW